jgi:hypothetical protein
LGEQQKLTAAGFSAMAVSLYGTPWRNAMRPHLRRLMIMSAHIQVQTLLIPIFIIALTIISRADVVIDWNIIATTAAPAAGKNALEQSRIYAMTHAGAADNPAFLAGESPAPAIGQSAG